MSGALWGPPANLRLVVLDLETCVAPGNAHRIVALGVAICRAGGIKQRFGWLINPEVPVDRKTTTIHHLTDEHLADEPTFAEVLPEFARLLEARNRERVVLAAHWAGFDVPVLRNEIARVKGEPLPELPILDTAGPLVRLAGVSLRSHKLTRLLETLGIENHAAHDALADASATAESACELLRRAEEAGYTDLDALLTELNGGTTGSMVAARQLERSRAPKIAAPVVTPSHIETHGQILPEQPTPGQFAQWRTWIGECASLRCDGLAGRSATAPPRHLRTLLLAALRDAAAAGDQAGAATVLGALMPLLGLLPDTIEAMRAEGPQLTRLTGQRGQRGVAVALHNWLEALLAPIERCGAHDQCPACRAGDPCPTDVWRAGLVSSVISADRVQVVAFWNTRSATVAASSKGAGRGYAAMHCNAPLLADTVLRFCHAFYREHGEAGTAAQLTDQVWRQEGCRDPYIAEARAITTSAGGRPTDLVAALRDCRRVLRARNGSTDPAWSSLAIRAAQVGARLARLTHPPTEHHHSLTPQRPTRQPRFLRAG